MGDQAFEKRWEYVKDVLAKHIKLHFREEAVKAFESVPIEIYSSQLDERSPQILLPSPQFDNRAKRYDDRWSVRIGQQNYVLWGRVSAPSDGEWQAWPNAETPLYFRRFNTVVLAFDLISNVFSLLTLEEERNSETRDEFGRFLASFSPRKECGLLRYPAINYMAAILVSLSRMLNQGAPEPMDIEADVLPPIVVLSHDVDNISGSSFWLQGARIFRFLKPLARRKMPDFRQISYILYGLCFPKRQYDDFSTFVDTEAKYGAHSSFYFITGKGGRYGARYKLRSLREKVELLRSHGHEVGIHMNFHGWDNVDSLKEQQDVLHSTFHAPITGGRGHYLRFDSRKSWGIWSEAGLQYDTTVGYAYDLGFRAGIAGPFRPFDFSSNAPAKLLEIPMNVMDGAFMSQEPGSDIQEALDMLEVVSGIGGAFSLLWHSGALNNPEYPGWSEAYEGLLRAAYDKQARFMTGARLLEIYESL